MAKLIATVSLIIVFCIIGCRPQDIGEKTNWQALQLTGKTLELIDPSNVEIYQFGNDEAVAATFGKKDGWVTGPVLYWKIENNNLLISEDSQFKDAEAMPPPYLKNDIVTINRTFLWWEKFRLSNN